jgi:predicted membrane protein
MMPGRYVERLTAGTRTIRAASFVAALAVSLALMLFPFLLRHVPETRLHSALPIILLGVTGSIIHGIGYLPDNRLLKILFGPACSWAMMIGGMFLLFTPWV